MFSAEHYLRQRNTTKNTFNTIRRKAIMKFTGEKFIPSEVLSNDEIMFEHLHRYHSIINLIKNKVVLDIACGEGYGSALIAEHAKNVVGVDIDQESIILAGEKYGRDKNNLEFKYGSADAIPCDNEVFDIVVSFETIEHLTTDTQNGFMKEIKRVLKLGGLLIMSTPDKKNYSERYNQTNPFHLREFYREEFIAFVRQYFKHVAFFEQGFEVVSLISNHLTEQAGAIEVHHLQRETPNNIERKYVIAVVSDNKLGNDISTITSMVPRVGKDYFLLMDRLISMNKEIEELGKWGNALHKELEEARMKINNASKTILLQSESIQKYAGEKKMAEHKHAQIEQKLMEAATVHQQLSTDKSIAEKKIADISVQLQSSTAEIKVLKSAIEENRVVENNMRSEISTLQISLQALAIEINELKLALDEGREKEIKLKSEIKSLDLLVKSSAEENSGLRIAIEKSRISEVGLKKEISVLTTQVSEKEQKHESEVAENHSLKNELAQNERLITKTIERADKLEANVENYIKKIKQQEHLLRQQSNTIQSLIDYKQKSMNESLDLQQKLREKECLTEELNQKNHELYQEVNLAKESLSEIYNSDGWRLLKIYYKVKGRVLPEYSNRYKRVKKIFNYLRPKSAPATSELSAAVFQTETLVLATEMTKADYDHLELPYFDYPLVSIIIPVFNAWEMNYPCIESIIGNTVGVAYEVILADDCSTDITRECSDIIKNIVHIRNEKNLGFLNNCNNAAKFAKGKHILFLNNDTRVRPNWLSPLVKLIESDDIIGMVGAKLIYPDGRLQEAGGIIWDDASGWNYGHSQNPELPEYNYVKEVDYISGAAILIRKHLWDQVGGFDKHFTPAYCEDSDLAFMLRKKGYKVMYQPLSEVIHYEGYSHGTDSSPVDNVPVIKSYQIINRQKLYEKWQPVLAKDHFPNAQNVFKARDKSKFKKTILVIDHYVPHFDKDAGSKTTFQYLELFASLGLNIKFLGDNFFKHEPYTTALQQMGIEVLYGVWYRDHWKQWIKDNKDNIDFVYINRPHISIKYIDFIKEFTKATILYYGHDLHFLREEMQHRIQKDPALLESAAKWKKTEMYLFENSDIILTPSEDEKNIISSLSPSYRVETILPYFFKKQATAITDFSERNHILFVGGFGHTPNLDAVEWFSREVWPLVTQKISKVKFVVVGSNPPESIMKLQSDSIEIKGFVSESELQAAYKNSRLVVVPLRYGAGVKGKTVEAMNFGLPIVSTSFGVEGMPGDSSSFIHPHNEHEDFANEVIRLYNNINLLKKISAEEANYINTYFTHDAAAIKMKAMLGINQ